VVAGILIAFWLDAWWDRTSARASEIVELAGVRLEVSEGIQVLERFLDIQTRYGIRLDHAMTQVASNMGSTVTLSDSTLQALVAWRTVDVSTAALNALIASGRLGTIRSSEVRTGLASYPTVLADLYEDEELARDFVELVLVPRLAPHGLLPAAYENHPMTRNLLGLEGTRGPEGAIQATPEILGLMAARRMHVRASEWGLQNVIGRAQHLIERLDEEVR
jgi:hypothetical protein